MGDREELQELRRLAELEARAGGTATMAPPQPALTEGEAIASSAPARFLSAAAAPGRTVLKALGPDSIKQQIANVDAMRQRGMEKQDTGFDWAGLVGSFLPGSRIAKTFDTAVPVAKTGGRKILEAMGIGGASAGAQPVQGDELSTDKLGQVGLGAATGGVLGAAAQGGKAFLGTNRLNPTQAATLAEGQAAGYTVPPSMVNPSGLNNTLESFAGKDAVKQAAASRNQLTTNALAARSLGLPTDQPITPRSLKSVRDAADQVYGQVDNLGPTAKTALRELRDARYKTGLNYDHYFASKNPEALEKAEYHKGLAKLFEQEIENEAKAAGRPDLVKALADARMKIAKSYDVEKALSESDSNVSAPVLARSFDKKGGKAMTGDLATVGKMGDAFSPVMREGARVPVAGVSGTDAITAAMLGTAGYYGSDGPGGIALAALPWIARPSARNLVLSPAYQKYAAQGIPSRYAPLIDALTQQAVGAGGATVGRNY